MFKKLIKMTINKQEDPLQSALARLKASIIASETKEENISNLDKLREDYIERRDPRRRKLPYALQRRKTDPNYKEPE